MRTELLAKVLVALHISASVILQLACLLLDFLDRAVMRLEAPTELKRKTLSDSVASTHLFEIFIFALWFARCLRYTVSNRVCGIAHSVTDFLEHHVASARDVFLFCFSLQ